MMKDTSLQEQIGYIDIVDNIPYADHQKHLRIENAAGQSLNMGTWMKRHDGVRVLRLTALFSPYRETLILASGDRPTSSTKDSPCGDVESLASTNARQVGGQHYKKARIQHWDFVLANAMPYMEAQIFRYILRWRDKNGMEDLRKAQHYLEKLIEWEENQQKTKENK